MMTFGGTLLSLAMALLAGLDPLPSDGVAIPAGHEDAIERLFLPYETGRDVVPGASFDGIRIEGDHIDALLVGPEPSATEVRFSRAGSAPSAERTASFAVAVLGDRTPAALEAAARLVAAVRGHDDGTFWEGKQPRTLQAPTLWEGVLAVLNDGVLRLLALAGILAWLVATNLGGRRDTALVLAAITLGAALIRWLLAPETTLDTFPYFRTNDVARLVYEGPILRHLNALLGGVIRVNEVAFPITFLFATTTPLGVFVLARALGATTSAALWAAATLAVLPGHIRFSLSETPFIPTLLVACQVFGLAAIAGTSPSRRARWIAVTLFVALAWEVASLRAIAFVYPLLALALLVPRGDLGRRRLAFVLALGAIVVAIAVPTALRSGRQTAVTIGPAELGRVLVHAVDPACNTLVNWNVTPPIVLLSALLGAWVWFRRDVKGPLLLVLWGGLLFATHAVLVSPTVALQSRYNLHLLPAVAVFGGVGLDAVARRWRRGGLIAAVVLVLAPLPHLAYITDVAFADQQEYDFVRAVRERIPDGCTVVEFVGDGSGESETTSNARFSSLGVVLKDGELVRRLRSLALYDPRRRDATGDGAALAPRPGTTVAAARTVTDGLRQLAADPPDCLYVYEGLACFEENNRPGYLSPSCALVRRELKLTPVASEAASRQWYDRPAPRDDAPPGWPTTTLYRVDTRR